MPRLTMQYQALSKVGSRRNGNERDRGTIHHAVPVSEFGALCGTKPRGD